MKERKFFGLGLGFCFRDLCLIGISMLILGLPVC